MVDICEGASATGEDAFHPGESILSAGESYQELNNAGEPSPGEDVQELGGDNGADKSEGEHEEPASNE